MVHIIVFLLLLLLLLPRLLMLIILFFLFVFLPVVLAVYYLFLRKTKRLKNIFLLIASLFFYAWGEPVHVFLMIAVILANWLYGILVDHFRERKTAAKLVLLLMVLTDIGVLGWFKYSGFVVENINRFLKLSLPVPKVALPIGISFYTFQTMSYTIDVYRKVVPAQHNIVAFATYVGSGE